MTRPRVLVGDDKENILKLFQKILAGAALDAGVQASIVGHFSAAADHPVLLSFPEGDYLKGLLLRRG